MVPLMIPRLQLILRSLRISNSHCSWQHCVPLSCLLLSPPAPKEETLIQTRNSFGKRNCWYWRSKMHVAPHPSWALKFGKKRRKTYQCLRRFCSSVRFVLTYLAMLMDECFDHTARLDNRKVTSTPWSPLKRGPRIKRPSRKASALSNIAPNARRSTTGILVGYRGYVLRFLFV